MDTTGQPRQRDIMYCHQCENEWYRDEHGLTCPECQSDFTEIVEAGNDPRQDNEEEEEEGVLDLEPHQPPPNHGDLWAPDPDEVDIDGLRWEQTAPGRYRVRGTYRTDIDMGQARQAQQQQGGLMGLVGGMLQNMIGGQVQGEQQQQQQRQLEEREGQNTPGRPASAPGSPPPNVQVQTRPNGGSSVIRHGSGPGWSYTIATSSNANFGAGGIGLFPRNANGPQPFQHQPESIEQMMNQMFMNIGAMQGGMRGGTFHDNEMHPGFGGNGPFIMGGPGGVQGGPGMGPFAGLLQMFAPPGGIAGDAVYTQEALDRIMTQLMEQHQAGNAPGPAPAEAIQALPKRAITKDDQGETGKADCSICMDEIALGGIVTVLPCTHWFHHECIKAWLSEHDTCPHCRQGIMPKEDEGSSARASVPRSPSQPPLHDMHSPQYTRPAGMPGTFPFPRQNSSTGEGSAQTPFVVPDNPNLPRRSNSTGGPQPGSSSGGGLFSSMRNAFGGRSSSGGAGGSSSGGDKNEDSRG